MTGVPESPIDRALAAIDAGLQSSAEVGYGRTDHSQGRCARCQRHDRPDGGDLCPGCRAYLLEDSDHDPAGVEPLPCVGTVSAWFDLDVADASRASRAFLRVQAMCPPADRLAVQAEAERRLTHLGAIEAWRSVGDDLARGVRSFPGDGRPASPRELCDWARSVGPRGGWLRLTEAEHQKLARTLEAEGHLPVPGELGRGITLLFGARVIVAPATGAAFT